jgi:L-alanine-DL-glutamate epimerase-like enolase superfamily enzyme
LARRAQRAGIEVVLTSVVDSAIGVAAAAHLAAAIAPAIAHGLATSTWLAEDVATALPIVAGVLRLADLPGLGIEPRLG